MKYLIVNADDYGLTPQVSAGIRKAHLEGILTSTTVLMNLSGVENELETVLTDCPKLGLGVHLNITDEMPPLLPPERLPVLLGLSDGKVFPENKTLRANVETISLQEIEAEWRAQIERFVAVTGRNPDHLDSHYHDSYMTFEMFELMLKLARELKCAVRMPPYPQKTWLPRLDFSVSHPDFFADDFYGEGASLATLRQIIAELQEGVTEVMSHPSLPDETLALITGYADGRTAELEALTSPIARDWLKAGDIKLLSFSELLGAQ